MQVTTTMRAMVAEDSSNAVSTSFLLDDDSRYSITSGNNFYISLLVFDFAVAFFFNVWICGCSIPFSVDDISKSMQEVEVADVDPPPLIRENSGFGFLLARSE
jgi:myosin-5